MRRLAPRFVLALAVLATPAAADCLPEGGVFSCQIGDKRVEICHETDIITYSFGPPGQPEMQITEAMDSVAFTPWPGVSSAIWETVLFTNDGYGYEVWTSQERNAEEDAPLEGGVRVLQGEELVAELTCDPGTPSNSLEMIWDLKESVGLCWEFGSQSWKTTCDNG
ncbi:MAG: hypothetical protein JNK34_09845 [Tabrizicola sp.]|nr:hypothetical protein [Tabrizicola sp.]